MIGVIERIKNNVLLKCSTLNEKLINETLKDIMSTCIYRFAEELKSLIDDVKIDITEESIRKNINDLIKLPITKKIKRKLFIDSLALQITNDSYIEDYVNKKIDLEKLKKSYIKELNKNKTSNQLNMTEDLKLDEIFKEVYSYIDLFIINYIRENSYLSSTIKDCTSSFKKELELDLETMIKDGDTEYLNILISELKLEFKDDLIKEEEGTEELMDNNFENEKARNSKFDKYDDMTLFNKTILSLNTIEEKLSRKEAKLENRKAELDQILADTNKNIESNIERENKLSQRRLDLNNREIELNSKLSEAEVIFLNMKPLIDGLSKIKSSDVKDGE